MQGAKKHSNIHLFPGCSMEDCATNGSDKKVGAHGYTLHYQKYFQHLKNFPIRLLEIGITRAGPSLTMWENFFPNAQIFGIDNVSGCSALSRPRVKVYEGDVENFHFVKDFLQDTGGDFNIIIDDCSHQMKQQIYLFETFFPTVSLEGIYVVEDLHTSYWPAYGGGYKKEGTMIEFLKELVDYPNHEVYKEAPTQQSWYTKEGNWNPKMLSEPPTWFEQNIYSIHFYKSIVFIFKGNNYFQENKS